MLWVAVLLPSLSLEVYARAWPADAHARVFVVDSGGRDPRIVAGNAAALADTLRSLGEDAGRRTALGAAARRSI